MCFPRKSQKFVIFLGEIQELSALEANINSLQQISVKYFPFPHPDIGQRSGSNWGVHLFEHRC